MRTKKMIFSEYFLKKLNEKDEKDAEHLLGILYFLEDLEGYENKQTSATIDFLQDLLYGRGTDRMNWNIENLIASAMSSDFELYEEIYKQLKEAKKEKYLQDLKTLMALSWEVVQEEIGASTTLSRSIYDLYYNKDLKEKTLKEILGSETFNALYENI